MADKIMIAVKPKYPTRRAVDKVLYKDREFCDVVNVEVARQALSLMGTSYVAIIKDGKYYPVDEDTCAEQYELLKAGEDLTVEEDESFAFKKIESFASAVEETDAIAQIQSNIEVYNGKIMGTLFRVAEYDKLGIAKITENGYWLAINFDLAGAETEGYSNLKFIDNTEVADGINYIFMGKDKEEADKKVVSISGKFTVNKIVSEEACTFLVMLMLKKFTSDAMAEIPAIECDGRVFDTLADAIAVAQPGSEIKVNKNVEADAEIIIDKEVGIGLYNNARILFTTRGKTFSVNESGKLTIIGEGSVEQKNPWRGVVVVNGTDNEVIIGSGVTLKGWAGLMVNKNALNYKCSVYGRLVGCKSGSDNGCGIYVNGTAKEGTIDVYNTEITAEGHGIFASGKASISVSDSKITGTDCGIEIRAGVLKVKDSEVISTYEGEPAMVPNGNGSTTVGAGIAVAQHTTKYPIIVMTTGKKIKVAGKVAFFEGNPQENAGCTEKMDITLSDGLYIGDAEAVKTLKPEEDCKNFIIGGTYNVKPALDFVNPDYKANQYDKKYIVEEKTEDDRYLDSLHFTKLDDYLYSAEYAVADLDATNKFIADRVGDSKFGFGGCSGIHVGNIRGRNFDWFYNNDVVVVVKTPAVDGRHAVIGMSRGITSLTKDMVESGKYYEIYKHIPCAMLDGVNDAGLCVQTNMISGGDIKPTEHTKEGYKSLCNLLVCKYMLDNAATLEEAIALLKKVDVWPCPAYGELLDLHWLVSDTKGNVAVIEIINGEIVVTETNAMTNYHVGTPELQLHACGTERMYILKDGEEAATSEEAMLALMGSIFYTKMYKRDTDPFWYSEYNANDKYGDLTIFSKPEDYAEKIDAYVAAFESTTRESGLTWQTVFTSVYNTETKVLTVMNQEDATKKFTFYLNEKPNA